MEFLTKEEIAKLHKTFEDVGNKLTVSEQTLDFKTQVDVRTRGDWHGNTINDIYINYDVNVDHLNTYYSLLVRTTCDLWVHIVNNDDMAICATLNDKGVVSSLSQKFGGTISHTSMTYSWRKGGCIPISEILSYLSTLKCDVCLRITFIIFCFNS